MMKISEDLRKRLICPVTKADLRQDGEYYYTAQNPDISYPIIDGVPILLNEENSLFTIEELSRKQDTTLSLEQDGVKKAIKKMLPSIGRNFRAADNIKNVISLLPPNARILVIGGGIEGAGMGPIYTSKTFDVVSSDVMFGPRTTLISDAHDVPFKEDTFDCVVIQAVLEHVLDPYRCAEEAFRVLKPSGIIYADTPFMQQVHMKQYDFTRFTYLGHRRLFRHFEEVDSGPSCGPGMALAWSYTYFLKSFATSRKVIGLLTVFAQLTSFYLKYFDLFLLDKPGAHDAASGFFFIGRKSEKCLSDKELIQQFKGLG